MIRSLLLLSALGAVCAFAPAHAETSNCTNISTLPAVITTQGVYCLKQDLATGITSGAAITINTNNVTIDCNDWKIGGLSAGAGTAANGIYADSRLNITIRHCGVRGFQFGIYLQGDSGAGHLVEDNRADLNTFSGISVAGDGNVVRRNRVVDTGGGPNASQTDAIIIRGAGAVVSDNLVSGVTVTGSGTTGSVNGINVFGGNHEFSNNVISGLVAANSGTPRGIFGSSFGSYRNNTMIGTGSGIGLDAGSSASMCSGNRIRGFPTAMTTCLDGGGNLSN